jgi:hypothetical protein
MEQILRDRINEEGGPLVYAMETEEEQQRSFDSTARSSTGFSIHRPAESDRFHPQIPPTRQKS